MVAHSRAHSDGVELVQPTRLEFALLDPQVRNRTWCRIRPRGGRLRHTSLLQPTFETDGLRVQCPTEPTLEQPAARSVSTRPSAALRRQRGLVPPASSSSIRTCEASSVSTPRTIEENARSVLERAASASRALAPHAS